MSTTVLARLRAQRLSLYRVVARCRTLDRAAGRIDAARWPADFFDALTLARKGY